MLLIAYAFHYPSFPDLVLTALKLFFPPLTKLIIHVFCSHRSAQQQVCVSGDKSILAQQASREAKSVRILLDIRKKSVPVRFDGVGKKESAVEYLGACEHQH